MKYLKLFEVKNRITPIGQEPTIFDNYIDEFLIKQFEEVFDERFGEWWWEKVIDKTVDNIYVFDIFIKSKSTATKIKAGLFKLKPEVDEHAIERFIEGLTVIMMESLGIFNSLAYEQYGSLKNSKIWTKDISKESKAKGDVEYRITCDLKEGVIRGFKSNLMGFKK